MHKGRLKNWNDGKGFGFIESSELDQNTFIHISTLKAMSRKPKIGDHIYFEVEKQADGKVRAVNCRIEGVAVKSLKQHKPRAYNRSSGIKGKMIVILAIIAIAIFAYSRLASKPYVSQTHQIQTLPDVKQSNFQCDGRQHCSQMTSRAEAEFFTRNCPNTKMDGDSDGIPCENDSRF